jgi:hypothetical protein
VAGTCIVILSSGSIFVESIANRLRQQMQTSDFRIINSRQADTLEQVVAAQPALVIAEAADSRLEQVCPLNSLLAALPKLTILRLDPYQDRMQVVTSEHRPSRVLSGLISTIQSAVDQGSGASTTTSGMDAWAKAAKGAPSEQVSPVFTPRSMKAHNAREDVL